MECCSSCVALMGYSRYYLPGPRGGHMQDEQMVNCIAAGEQADDICLKKTSFCLEMGLPKMKYQFCALPCLQQ